MREHLVSENSVCDLRRVQEIHLKQTRLLGTLIRPVIFQCVKKECRRLLNHVLSEENIDNTIDVNKSAALFVGKLVGEFGSLLRIQSDNVLKKTSIVRRVAGLFCVWDDFVELARFRKTCDNLKLAEIIVWMSAF